jgi:hypothetical protein
MSGVSGGNSSRKTSRRRRNLAESELAVLTNQCLSCRIPDKQTLEREVAAWQDHRNKHHAKADWQFTPETANRFGLLVFQAQAMQQRDQPRAALVDDAEFAFDVGAYLSC